MEAHDRGGGRARAGVGHAAGEADTALHARGRGAGRPGVPSELVGDLSQRVLQVALHGALAAPDLLTLRDEVLDPEFERVHAQRVGNHVYLRLAHPDGLWPPDGAVGARRGRVREYAIRLHPLVRHRVGARHSVAEALRHPDAVVRVSAGVDVADAIPGHDGAVVHHAGADGAAGGVTAHGPHGFINAQGQAHRPARLAAEGCYERLDLGVRLAAVAAAHEGDDDLHLVQLASEEASDLRLHEERVLRRRPEPDAVRLVARDAGVRLHRVVVDHRELERVLEDAVALADRGVDVAPLVAVLMAEVGVVHGFASLGERFVDAGDRREFLVLDLDELDRGLGGREVDCGDCGDRLALEAHLVHSDDGAVLLVGAVVRLHVDEFCRREHRVDAGERPCPARVDPRDAGVRQWTRHEFAVRHSGYLQVAGELRAAREFVVRVDPAHRCADRFEFARCHRLASAASWTASTIFL